MWGKILQHPESVVDIEDVKRRRLSLRPAPVGARGPMRPRGRTQGGCLGGERGGAFSSLAPIPTVELCEEQGVSLTQLARIAEEAAQ